jgi:glutamyl-tRNA reductase
MSIFIIGLSHKTAAIDLREKLALNTPQSERVLLQLKKLFDAAEFALLSTCNRVELYVVNNGPSPLTPDHCWNVLLQYQHASPEEFGPVRYIHHDEKAVEHLLNVTASLDSMVIGEPQITAQVKECYQQACDAKTTGKILNRLFHCAFSTGKEIYANTSIAQRRVSVAGVAVDLVRQLFTGLAKTKVLVLGAGEMGELLVQHLLSQGAKNITLANRTLSRAEAMAKKYGLSTVSWEQRFDQLVTADVVIAAATIENYLIDQQQCRKITKKRRGKTLLLIDIAVPRNLDPAINDLDDVYLYAIDDLAQFVQENLDARQDDRKQADAIIQENMLDFMEWLDVKDLGPLLGQMKDKFREISQKELANFMDRHAEMPEESKRKIEKLINRMVNKQMHCLIHNLDEMARENNPAGALDLVNRIIQYSDKSN